MADISGPILADTGTVTACVDASDSATLVCAEDGGESHQGPDVPSAFLGYFHEQFIPTTVRQGQRLRKDPWTRIGWWR